MANQNRWRTFPARILRPLTICFTHHDTTDMSTRPLASLTLPDHDHESTMASITRLEQEDQGLQRALHPERPAQLLRNTPVTLGTGHGRRHRSRGRKSMSEKEVIPKRPTCTICTEAKGVEELLKPCPRCQELWCHGCIRTFFIGATWDSDRMPARCCHKVMHHGIAKGIVDDQELAAYKLRYEEFCTPKPFYCPARTCSRFISPRQVKAAQGGRPLTCPDCHTLICTKCRLTADPRPRMPTKRSSRYHSSQSQVQDLSEMWYWRPQVVRLRPCPLPMWRALVLGLRAIY